MDALGRGDLEEGADLRDDIGDSARLAARRPCDVLPCIGSIDQIALRPARARRAHQRRQLRARCSAAPKRPISTSRPGRLSGSSRSISRSSSSGARLGPHFRPDRVGDAAGIFDMGAVELAGALADPDHVRRGRPPVLGRLVPAGQRLLVIEQQRLVAGEHLDRPWRLGRGRPRGASRADRHRPRTHRPGAGRS